jgi:hypothetical protein
MNAVTPAAPVTPSAGTPPPVDPAAPQPSLTGAPGADPAKPADPVIPDPIKPGDPPKDPPKEPEPAPAAFALDKVKLPEGMKADDPTLATFGNVLADDKLSPLDRGQKLLDLYADTVKQGREAATQAWNDVNKQWQDATMALPEIGGAKWNATKATIAKAIDSLGTEHAAAFREALDVTGAGNHPAVTRALHAWAAKLTEGSHIGGNPPGATPTIKEAFYPNSPDMK